MAIFQVVLLMIMAIGQSELHLFWGTQVRHMKIEGGRLYNCLGYSDFCHALQQYISPHSSKEAFLLFGCWRVGGKHSSCVNKFIKEFSLRGCSYPMLATAFFEILKLRVKHHCNFFL